MPVRVALDELTTIPLERKRECLERADFVRSAQWKRSLARANESPLKKAKSTSAEDRPKNLSKGTRNFCSRKNGAEPNVTRGSA